jgi:2-polyprenyl-6-methoxyphenol hydroxylase-like FAD-dependent oxidoreductase
MRATCCRVPPPGPLTPTRPLLIGDAAHVMSTISGNGINYAVQDAAAAGNIFPWAAQGGPHQAARPGRVQRRCGWPAGVTQAIVTQIQDRLLGLLW